MNLSDTLWLTVGIEIITHTHTHTVRYCFKLCVHNIVLFYFWRKCSFAASFFSYLKSQMKTMLFVIISFDRLSMCVYFHVMVNFSALFTAQINMHNLIKIKLLYMQNGMHFKTNNLYKWNKSQRSEMCIKRAKNQKW